ncbi:hypothetical protein [Lentibacillus jeotgali]|uniref:hypothetical protein n=1 Tax=Lentibacillus jeotgali TaxID=558169 RepID=UPI0002625C5E|nr:hypothetical protein [Lentibacillus jeotgali]
MDKKKRKETTDRHVTAPGIDPDDSFGEPATEEDIENGESTRVTRMTYDEYDPSEK